MNAAPLPRSRAETRPGARQLPPSRNGPGTKRRESCRSGTTAPIRRRHLLRHPTTSISMKFRLRSSGRNFSLKQQGARGCSGGVTTSRAGKQPTPEETKVTGGEREPGTAPLPANTFLFQFFRSVASRLHQQATGSGTPPPSIIRKPSARRGAATDARRGTTRSVASGPPRTTAHPRGPEPGAPRAPPAAPRPPPSPRPRGPALTQRLDGDLAGERRRQVDAHQVHVLVQQHLVDAAGVEGHAHLLGQLLCLLGRAAPQRLHREALRLQQRHDHPRRQPGAEHPHAGQHGGGAGARPPPARPQRRPHPRAAAARTGRGRGSRCSPLSAGLAAAPRRLSSAAMPAPSRARPRAAAPLPRHVGRGRPPAASPGGPLRPRRTIGGCRTPGPAPPALGPPSRPSRGCGAGGAAGGRRRKWRRWAACCHQGGRDRVPYALPFYRFLSGRKEGWNKEGWKDKRS